MPNLDREYDRRVRRSLNRIMAALALCPLILFAVFFALCSIDMIHEIWRGEYLAIGVLAVQLMAFFIVLAAIGFCGFALYVGESLI